VTGTKPLQVQFAGSKIGGERAAAIYTVIETPAFAGAGSAK
jgi:hypothetical protein